MRTTLMSHVLETARLQLRRLALDDEEALFAAFSDFTPEHSLPRWNLQSSVHAHL